MKSNNKNFELVLEIIDNFLSSNRVRCIGCCCIITDSEQGVICDSCYSKLTPGQLQDLEMDD